MKKEIWKDIPEYEGVYQASTFGRIKSLSRKVRNGMGFYFTKERILKNILGNRGYFTVALCKNGIAKVRTVHQLIAVTHLNHVPCGYKLVVDHKDFNRQNNYLNNLKIITFRENTNQKHLNSKYKYTCVGWSNHAKKWRASIRHNNKSKHIGYFDDEYEASLAVVEYKKEHNLK